MSKLKLDVAWHVAYLVECSSSMNVALGLIQDTEYARPGDWKTETGELEDQHHPCLHREFMASLG